MIDNTIVQQAYGDCIWIGASGPGLSIPTHNLTITNSRLDTCGRQGMSFAQTADGIFVSNTAIVSPYLTAIDTEPGDAPIRDVVVEHCYLGGWWDRTNTNRTGNTAMTIEGGKLFAAGQTTNARKFRVFDNTVIGGFLIENAEDVVFQNNRVVTDWAGYSYAPMLAQMWLDDIWIVDNYFYDRTNFPLANSNHDATIQIWPYVSGNLNKQPTGIHVARNHIHSRNGRMGIRISGTGGFAFGSGAVQSPRSGTSTLVTATTLVDSGSTWTDDQWVGYTVYTGGAAAEVASNKGKTLYLYQPAYPQIGLGLAWYSPLGELANTPLPGTYIITQRSNIVDVDDNQIDMTNDGNGAGADGISVDAFRAGMRVRIRGNTIKNANVHAINIQPVDANRPFIYLQITDNHAFDDQVSHTCADTVHFTSASPDISHNIAKLVFRGNTNDTGCTSNTSGLTSGVWLLNDGNVQEWAGYGSPETANTAVGSANVGSTFKRLDGSGGTSNYIKSNTGWVPVGGVVATGTVTCVPKVNLVDTDYMTIGDGISPPKLYEFDTAGNGVTAGRIQVNVSGDTTAPDVCARLKAAIDSNQPILASANVSGVLTITHDLAGTFANVSITENVANAGFLVSGMSGGINPAR
jgi:hypothetical protein